MKWRENNGIEVNGCYVGTQHSIGRLAVGWTKFINSFVPPPAGDGGREYFKLKSTKNKNTSLITYGLPIENWTFFFFFY